MSSKALRHAKLPPCRGIATETRVELEADRASDLLPPHASSSISAADPRSGWIRARNLRESSRKSCCSLSRISFVDAIIFCPVNPLQSARATLRGTRSSRDAFPTPPTPETIKRIPSGDIRVSRRHRNRPGRDRFRNRSANPVTSREPLSLLPRKWTITLRRFDKKEKVSSV